MKPCSVSLGVILLAAACGASEPHGNRSIGVVDFRVAESGDTLSITGVDATGAAVASLDVRIGIVDVPDVGVMMGREISAKAAAATYTFPSGGMGELYLPVPPDAALASLMLDPYVKEVLGRWNITYASRQEWFGYPAAPPALSSEVGYSYCTPGFPSCDQCWDYTAPCQGAGARSTCEEHYGTWNGQNQWRQLVSCNNDSRAERTCTNPNSTSSCGATGPNGCAPCGPSWAGPAGGTTVCDTSTGTCGWSGSGGGGGGGGGNGCDGTCAPGETFEWPCCQDDCGGCQ